jgi:hypothetical protein
MEKCKDCGAPTSLHVNNVPLCLACDLKRERAAELKVPKAQSAGAA